MEKSRSGKRGRPKNINTPMKYFPEEEKKEAISCKRSETKYMRNKEWYSNICNKNYSLAAKWSHLKTKKHRKNVVAVDIMNKIDQIIHNNF